jgi:hypothetical protein
MMCRTDKTLYKVSRTMYPDWGMHGMLRVSVPDVPTGRQSANQLAGCPWHGGPRRDAPPLLSPCVPMAAHAQASPARLGMVFAL